MIGNNIRKLRMQHGMTQKNLAEKLFVSAQAVSRWENDEVEPSIGTILELAKIFGVTADQILNPEEHPFRSAEEPQESSESSNEEAPEAAASEEASSQGPMLALCCKCNSPIYEKDDIVRGHEDKIYCKKCHEEGEKRRREWTCETAKKRRILSFVLGPLASAIAFAITFATWNHPLMTAGIRGTMIFLSVAMFTFVSCCLLENSFVADMFFCISSWSIKAPGLIFTFDLDGILWLIGMKILFAVIGFVIGVIMFFLGLVISASVSVFVYPYAIVTNIKHPEKDY